MSIGSVPFNFPWSPLSLPQLLYLQLFFPSASQCQCYLGSTPPAYDTNQLCVCGSVCVCVCSSSPWCSSTTCVCLCFCVFLQPMALINCGVCLCLYSSHLWYSSTMSCISLRPMLLIDCAVCGLLVVVVSCVCVLSTYGTHRLCVFCCCCCWFCVCVWSAFYLSYLP